MYRRRGKEIDTALAYVIGNNNGLGLTDFPAIRAVTIADGYLKFPITDLFDACHIQSSFTSSVHIHRVSGLKAASFCAAGAW